MRVGSIGNPICRLAECPIWNDNDNTLYWTDILEKRIWKYQPESNVIGVEWEGDLMVGGYAFTEDNDIVLCTDKGVYRLSRKSRGGRASELQLLFDIPMADDERFNDITTDPRGRIFAGTLTERRVDGILYRLESGKAPVAVLKDIATSNGMTFSLDLKYFFHTDSRARTITKYEYDPGTGDIGNPHVFYRGSERDGVPDGITIDLQDHIWVACWRGSKVIRLDPDGSVVRELPVPAIQPSSVVFGNENLDELYITSACQGCADLAKGTDGEGRYLGGEIYCVSPGVTGRREWPARF
ncbi:MAG: SMP-30/gluconolactonase/LRE family protein [Phycisphaerales bacterium]|nr:MAG: SMP-30/gluconolactonase/LRE family protein [Phycisphaerales bacterium]